MRTNIRCAEWLTLMFILLFRMGAAGGIGWPLNAVEQKIGGQVPVMDAFSGETGAPITLGALTADVPVILVLAYYECPRLCSYVLNGLAQGLDGISLQPGRDYRVVVVSIDPREKPALAAAKKEAYLGRIGRDKGAEVGWRFLTGDPEPIAALASATGFHYTFDSVSGEFAHPAAAIILAPGGRISRYLPGVEFRPRDLRLALVEASQGRMGSLADKIFLSCSAFDPATGRYTRSVNRVVQVLGISLVLGLACAFAWLERKGRRRSKKLAASAAARVAEKKPADAHG